MPDRELVSTELNSSGWTMPSEMLMNVPRERSSKEVLSGRRAKQLKQLKDEFFSLAAHEIRTPITVIKAQAQLAERFHAQGKLNGELMEKCLRVFVQESDRLARLCNDLLDIARLDSGCFEVHLSHFDLLEILREGVQKIAFKNELHRIFLAEPGMPIVIIADRERTEHVVANILNNAVRYSPQGGQVMIDVAQAGHYARVSVRDTGLGIAADKIERIFQRYYQAHQVGLKGPCGLGLGLYLCREALKRMKGDIQVASDGPGHGSMFTFMLPLARAYEDQHPGETT